MPLKAWDATVEKLIDNFEQFTDGMDSRISKRLLQVIAKLDTVDGRLTSQKLNTLFQEIDNIFKQELKASDYKKQIEKIHGITDMIVDANISIQKELNGINVTQSELNEVNGLELFKEKVVNNLSGAGITQNVIIPIKQMVNSAVTQGKGIGALMDEFEQLFDNGNNAQLTTVRGRSLLSYSRQIANDTTNAVNGTIQTYLADKYDLKAGRYIGNTIRDSRPFCKHMIQDEKYPMSIEHLRKVLKEYVGNKTKVPNGKLKSGKPQMVPKGAGMYSNTNAENFPTVVGGYNCRHRWFAVRGDEKDK